MLYKMLNTKLSSVRMHCVQLCVEDESVLFEKINVTRIHRNLFIRVSLRAADMIVKHTLTAGGYRCAQ